MMCIGAHEDLMQDAGCWARWVEAKGRSCTDELSCKLSCFNLMKQVHLSHSYANEESGICIEAYTRT